MEGGSYFKGSSCEQDPFLKGQEAKLLAKITGRNFDKKVDLSKVCVEVLKPWIHSKITELLGMEDEIVADYCYTQLEEHREKHKLNPAGTRPLDPRQLQLSLTGFLETKSNKFVEELWVLLLSAQEDPTGVPKQLIDQRRREKEEKLRKLEAIKSEQNSLHHSSRGRSRSPRVKKEDRWSNNNR